MKGTILIVDDHREYARYLDRLLTAFGYTTYTAVDAAQAKEAFLHYLPDVVLLDHGLPDGDGVSLLQDLKNVHAESQFVLVTADDSLHERLHAENVDTVDYLVKPCSSEQILSAVNRALHQVSMREEIFALRRRHSSAHPGDVRKAQYASSAMRAVMRLARRAAESAGIVLLLGEHGTGKERLARWIHDNGARSTGPFFSYNAVHADPHRTEADLFGQEAISESGVSTRKKGLIELCHRGTLYLGDIDRLHISLQSKILSFLETKRLLRVGGEELTVSDCRLIVGAGDLFFDKVQSGAFLEDLYYRINVFPISLPPLRARKPDIPVLVQEILEALSAEIGLDQVPQISSDALVLLNAYDWPGNIRELRNVLERTVMLGHTTTIGPEDIPLAPLTDREWHYTVTFPEGKTLHDVTKDVTRKLIEEALRRGGTKQEAARLLGISRHALAHQMKAVGIK